MDASKTFIPKKDYSVAAPAPSATWSAVIKVLRKSLIQLCYFCSPLSSFSHNNLNASKKSLIDFKLNMQRANSDQERRYNESAASGEHCGKLNHVTSRHICW